MAIVDNLEIVDISVVFVVGLDTRSLWVKLLIRVVSR